MKILVACEESQAVCIAFRERGHEAYSCDILPCSGGHPEWHIQDDVLKHLNDGWDMMIAFPPCTHLAVSGARHFEQKRKDGRQQQGIDFFMKFIKTDILKVAIENPVGIMSTIYRKPDCIIQPWMFGDEAQKTTCLWLIGLPPLQPTKIVSKGEFITFKSGKRHPKWYADAFKVNEHGKLRSKTFPGIAKALANQYGAFLESGLSLSEWNKLDILEKNRIFVEYDQLKIDQNAK